MVDKDRYTNIPISDKTREGMSINIDDLAAIGRLLSLQDKVYDEEFIAIKEALNYQREAYLAILDGMKEIRGAIQSLQDDIVELKTDIGNLKIELDKVTKTVDCTKDEVADLVKDVHRLKVLNSLPVIALRIAIGVVIGLILAQFMFF